MIQQVLVSFAVLLATVAVVTLFVSDAGTAGALGIAAFAMITESLVGIAGVLALAAAVTVFMGDWQLAGGLGITAFVVLWASGRRS